MKILTLCTCGLIAATGCLQAQHLDASLSVGTDGVGLNLNARLCKVVGLRAGVTYVPDFDYNMKFGVEMDAGDGSSGETSSTRYHTMATMMENFTGVTVNDYVTMVGSPDFVNFKFLVDFHPIPQDRRWTVTAGFYLGSETVAKAKNSLEDASTLLGVSIYNRMYEKAVAGEPLFTYGNIGVSLDPDMEDRFRAYGRMGINVGTYADGSTYYMEPNEHSLVTARIKTHKFKPYLGLGFGDEWNRRWRYQVDCGAMFWGGTPSVVTHDGTDLTELASVKGRPGDYVDIIKKFKVYPVLSFSVAYQLF